MQLRPDGPDACALPPRLRQNRPGGPAPGDPLVWETLRPDWRSSLIAILATDNPVHAARALVTHPCEYGAALRTFAKLGGLEPANNAAERVSRKGVLWRAGSGGSASAAGSRFVARMLTVCESLRAQGRSILGFLEDSVCARLTERQAPSLPPLSHSLA